MSTDGRPDNSGPAIFLALLILAGFLVVVAGLADKGDALSRGAALDPAPARRQTRSASPAPTQSTQPTQPTQSTGTATIIDPIPDSLPDGGQRVFDGRMLVAYYGTAGTGVLGVLGETTPELAMGRLERAARPFTRRGLVPQPVFELIVTVADRGPGKDRDFNHDIARDLVIQYVEAAHEHGVLLVLDIQPGRSDFLTVARRWTWALESPWVSLALDPEWRVGRHQVPGRLIGSVSAGEINRTSAWLNHLVERRSLPQKIFMLHQFRTSMIRDVHRVQRRPRLAMVQHVDGFGTQRQKLDTYHAVAVPDRFTMGFKLFYDEDIRRMTARQVKRIRPRIDFVSFQ